MSLWDMKQGLFEKKPWFLPEPTITREWLVKMKFVERQLTLVIIMTWQQRDITSSTKGFPRFRVIFKLTGQLNSAHAEGHFLWMGTDLHSV